MDYKIDIVALKTARSNFAAKKEEFVTALNKMNSAVESVKGVVSRSASNVIKKYEDAAASQSELKAAVDSYIAYLDKTISNYEEADAGSSFAAGGGNTTVSIN